MPIELRPYQTEIIAKTRALMRQGCRSILIQAPCGAGKTALTAHMLHTAASKRMRSFFVVHRRELIKQLIAAFRKEGLDYGLIAAGFYSENRPLCHIASIQTLARRYKRFAVPQLIVWDECHHLAAGSWRKVYNAFPNSFHIGLTATPERLDGQGLASFFKEIVTGPSISWLTERYFLSPYKLYAPSTVDLDGIHTRMGDYEKRELAQVVDKPSITGDAVEHYKRLADGKHAIVFCASIRHSHHVVEQFNSAGIPAHHIDGETPEGERDGAIERFKEGRLQVLSNVEIFGEGFDVPGIEVAILLRPTPSLSYYLQQVGRALRPFEGKTHALILDHVGNWSRHGLPDDDREWSLQGRAGRERDARGAGIAVKICPKCFAAQKAGMVCCRYCGFVFEVKPRMVQKKDGQLSEIDKEASRRESRRTQGFAQSLEELTQIGIERGYKFP